MNMAKSTSALAVDGGGTRCRFLLLHDGMRHVVDGGPANVSTNFDAATEVLRSGVSRLADVAGLSEEVVATCPAFVGIAGVTGPEIVGRLTRTLPFKNAVYADDRPGALRGALGDADGVIALCGTGSFFASQIGGVTRLAGGWGSVLGDEASAHWVGRRLLSMTLRSVDGFTPASSVTEAVLSQFGDAAGVVAFAGRASPAEIGALAPLVTQALDEGDLIARMVMQDAATDLADGLTGIGWEPGLTICLTGGIGPQFAPLLPKTMQADLQPPKAAPIEGAMALAQEHAARCAG
ncbi:MAG: BadF/BadG/BcrA/BcrD ATPase family protein [Pseudomonadota bacterium]